MKPLLLFLSLFACLNVSGQTKIETAPEDPITIMTIEGFLDEWQSYKDECYADSTKECRNFYRDLDGTKYYSKCSKYDIDLGINSAYIGTWDVWIHRESNFEGFMEYLTNKYK